MMRNENAVASDVAPQPHRRSSDEMSNADGADASRRQALCRIAAAFAASAGVPRGLAAMISPSAEPLTKPFRFNAVDRAGALRPGGDYGTTAAELSNLCDTRGLGGGGIHE